MEKQKYIEIKKNIVEKYKNKILPRCINLEQERKKVLEKRNIVLIVGILLLLFFSFIAKGTTIGVICISVALFIRQQLAKTFETKTKETIMQYFCECFANLKWSSVWHSDVENMQKQKESFAYSVNTSDLLKASNLFYTNSSSIFIYDDIFKGTHNETPFEFFEVHSSSYSRTNKKTKEESTLDLFFMCMRMIRGKKRNGTTRFSGLVIKIKLNKNFKSNTVIRPDSFAHMPPNFNLKHSVFEDVEFEKKFDVFTDDEVEARYLITTSFMERLNNLKVAFNTDKISCSFYNQELFIGLHTEKDLFKLASINKPMTDSAEFSKMFKEVFSIYEMIDYLKLTEKTKL